MKQKRKAIWLAAWMLSVAGGLQGCGGGGGSGSGTLSGVFLDAPVAGLSYRTATQAGLTDANGRFSYLPGEAVTFSLGKLELGTAPGKAEITLLDMSDLSSLPISESAFDAAVYEGNLPGPLNRVINMAVLLQSLDSDANPENGIEIDSTVAGYLDGRAIDLDRFYFDFADDGNVRNGRGLRGLLRAAAADSVLSARPVVHPALALQHFYGSVAVVPDLWRHSDFAADYDGDGSIDVRYSTEYDPSGAYAGQAYDGDGDGLFDSVTEYQRDQNLAELLYSEDNNADGTADEMKRSSYDSFGVLTATETLDASGAVIAFERLTYDEQGRLVRRELRSGSTHFVQHWTVDELGMRSIYEFDEDADGQVDVRSTLGYDGSERSDWWVSRDNDTNGDGAPDSRQTRRLDAQGRILSSVRDDDLDGIADYELQQQFDAQGRLIRQAVDNDGGGVDVIYEWAYDDALPGYLQFSDLDGDGAADRVTRFVLTESGDTLSREEDANADGRYETVTRFTYDSAGRRIGSERTVDAIAVSRATWFYDARGLLERVERDNEADGLIDESEFYSNYVPVGLGAVL